MPSEFTQRLTEELLKFQGAWVQIDWEADGALRPTDEFGLESTVVFTGNTYVVSRADGSIALRGTFTLDPTQEPKAIDWTGSLGPGKGKTFPAIYSFVGDVLVFCAANEGMRRPNVFHAHPGETLRVHRRLRGEAPGEASGSRAYTIGSSQAS